LNAYDFCAKIAHSTHSVLGYGLDTSSGINIKYEFPNEEDHYVSNILVNDQTLIGQCGGLLGILLGWSGMTILDSIEPLFNFLSQIIIFW